MRAPSTSKQKVQAPQHPTARKKWKCPRPMSRRQCILASSEAQVRIRSRSHTRTSPAWTGETLCQWLGTRRVVWTHDSTAFSFRIGTIQPWRIWHCLQIAPTLIFVALALAAGRDHHCHLTVASDVQPRAYSFNFMLSAASDTCAPRDP